MTKLSPAARQVALKAAGKAARAAAIGVIALIAGIAVGYADESLTKGEFWTALSGAATSAGAALGLNAAAAKRDGQA